MSYVDPAGAGTPTQGQPVSSAWGRDVQTDVELAAAALALLAPLAVNVSVPVPVMAAPTATVGTWAVAGGTSPTASNTSAAVNDSATWTTSLIPGTYDFRIIGVSSSSSGQIQFAVDGANVGGLFDEFNTNSFLLTAVVISTIGAHTIKVTVPSKNAGSSGFTCTLVSIIATRRS